MDSLNYNKYLNNILSIIEKYKLLNLQLTMIEEETSDLLNRKKKIEDELSKLVCIEKELISVIEKETGQPLDLYKIIELTNDTPKN